MIQPAASATLQTLGLTGEVPAQNPAEGVQTADFGALLAIQTAVDDQPELPATALVAPDELAVAPEAAAATPGKILPPALPDAAEAEATPGPARPLPVAAMLPGPKALSGVEPEAQEPKAKDEQPDEAATDMPVLPASVVETAPIPLAAAQPSAQAPVLTADRPGTNKTGEIPAPAQAPLHRAAPSLPAQASETAKANQAQHAAAPLQPVAPPAAEPVQGKSERLVPVPAEEVRVELALPRLAVAAPARDELRPALRITETFEGEPAPLLSTQTGPQLAANALPASPAPQVRPHDFAALIERIAVAREAAAPQAVSITVAHQDFGHVRLHFRPEDTGLSVAMTSPDPDFARAAAAAPVPVVPVANAEQAGFNQQRGDLGAGQNAAQGGQSQSRGAFAEQRREGQPQGNPSQRGGQQRAATRQGIFA